MANGDRPKIRTGVSWVDNTANNGLGVATAGLAGNSLNDIGKNYERNLQTLARNTIGIFQPGGLNNLGNTILQNTVATMSGGLADNGDTKNATGESGMDRKEREMTEKTVEEQANSAAADVATAQAEAKRQLESVISGAVDRKRRSPGKALSLLSGGVSGTNTLLDIGKK